MKSLHQSLAWLGVIVVFGLVAPGCSTDQNELVAPTSEAVGPTFSFVADQAVINHFNVHFDGRTVAGGNTTFTYTVSGTGVDPSMSHFSIELPPCAGAPVSYSPVGGANINTNPQSGVYGLQWNSSIDENNLVGVTFSVTFAGNVPLGIVRAEVRTNGGVWATGDVFGPCSGSRVDGRVFVDADNNGLQSPSEGGIGNVTVAITDGTETHTAATDAAGNYSFVVLPGSYTVSVTSPTPANDFNEDLFASFLFDVTSRTVNVPANAVENAHFAFEPKPSKITDDLEAGVLLTAGKPARFWKSELSKAINNRKGVYTAAQLTAFLQQIEAIGIADPYQFTDGNELASAMAVFNDNTNDLIVKLKKEVLASELNFVSGNGLVGESDLHEVLLLWGEELISAPAPTAGTITPMAIKDISDGSSALGMFGLMNGSTGGGGTDE